MTQHVQITKESFLAQVNELPVLDTHTHLVGDRLRAKDFWEIAHYFWFFREMQAAGYPSHAEELPEEERIEAFLDAYQATRNTFMNQAFTEIIRQLYGIEIKDEASIREADAAVRRSAQTEDWAQQVADRLNIRRFVVNVEADAAFQGMREDAIIMPRIDGLLPKWVDKITGASEPQEAFERVSEEISERLTEYKALGYPGLMTTLPGYASRADVRKPIDHESSRDDILMELLHVICANAERNDLLVQLFLGVERTWTEQAIPVNDPYRIVKLSSLFETYACQFELVLASELNNLDAVQAAWNFPNVHVGGMWWFNFRPSTYRDSMAYRLEALPGMKSSLIVSDARCMEWSYGKILLVKRLIGEFLWEQLESGWIDADVALMTAQEWLYNSAAKRYRIKARKEIT